MDAFHRPHPVGRVTLSFGRQNITEQKEMTDADCRALRDLLDNYLIIRAHQK